MISLKGSTLSIKGLGTARIEIVVLCILLGAFLCCNLWCSSCKFKILGEGFGTKLSELNNGNGLDNFIYPPTIPSATTALTGSANNTHNLIYQTTPNFIAVLTLPTSKSSISLSVWAANHSKD